MTSQINSQTADAGLPKASDCRRPENVPADYCRKLKNGLTRLQGAIQAQYETAFPTERERIARALREAREAAWETPFPSLFFPTLAHLRISEKMATA